ncbi:hypothetical protein OJAV_G00042080 [Oryzias javanicus]|uniref:Uncharacterized protein n=1 Tax=Oryzias javanicus TaxID=123683 RepID=A0A3S2MRD7_ORYJA|nr:hypothetical protein OJAV_G00042080 [Oryzias javanicus]
MSARLAPSGTFYFKKRLEATITGYILSGKLELSRSGWSRVGVGVRKSLLCCRPARSADSGHGRLPSSNVNSPLFHQGDRQGTRPCLPAKAEESGPDAPSTYSDKSSRTIPRSISVIRLHTVASLD